MSEFAIDNIHFIGSLVANSKCEKAICEGEERCMSEFASHGTLSRNATLVLHCNAF